MADLGVTYTQLQDAVSRHVGYGDDASSLDATRLAHVVDCVKSGLRQFYWPVPIDGHQHQWGFLTPVTSVTTNGSYATGTITSAGTTVTLAGTGAVWPSWVNSDAELIVSGSTYAVASRTSDTEIVLVSAPSSAFSGDTFTLVRRVYTLPSTFGHVLGTMTYTDTSLVSSLRMVGEGMIRELEQGGYSSGRPIYFSVRPKACDGSSQQLFQLVMYPYPDSAYTFRYRYSILPNMLVDTTNEYALGGPIHAETILQSCIAVAEHRINGTRGIEFQRYTELLAASIEADRMQQPDFLGYNGDGSDDGDLMPRFLRANYVDRSGVVY